MQSPDPSDPARRRPRFGTCLRCLPEAHDEPVWRISEREYSDGAPGTRRVRGRVDLVWCDPGAARSGHRGLGRGESAARPCVRRGLCREYRDGDRRACHPRGALLRRAVITDAGAAAGNIAGLVYITGYALTRARACSTSVAGSPAASCWPPCVLAPSPTAAPTPLSSCTSITKS